MGLYNFQKRFVPYLLDGTKTHTIRGVRAHPDKPGNTIHLYTGLRQKSARLLFRAPCVRVDEIEFRRDTREALIVQVNGDHLSRDEIESLFDRDGFRTHLGLDPTGRINATEQALMHWCGRLPFVGHMIHWDYHRRSL